MHGSPLVNGLLAGACAALVAAILHLVFLQPILLRAEDYETGARVHVAAASEDHHRANAADAPQATASAYPSRFDMPLDLARDGMTAGFFLVTYSAFGLLLAVAVGAARMRGYRPEAGHGVFWAAAGFAACQLVPSFGLPPEPPGLAAGELLQRQAWWLAVAAVTLATLWGVAFVRARSVWTVAGSMAIVALMFAVPTPSEFTGPVPPELSSLFATRSLGIAAVAWLVLGLLVVQGEQPSRVRATVKAYLS